MSSLLGGWEKNKTKTVTYATLYGAGKKKLADTMGVTLDEASDTKDLYFNTFPQIKNTIFLVNTHAKEAGYIKYWTGRRRHFPNTESPHKAFNSLIQGSGAEVVKWALIEIWETLTARNTNPLCKLVLTIHDSIVLEIKEGLEDVYLPQAQEIMERIPTEFFEMSFGVESHEWGM
jgi:DNA polymerase I-like protein with 3'-5' exonuclease and polymerase domains